MPIRTRGALPQVIIATLATLAFAGAVAGSPARADESIQTGPAPVVVIKSTSGVVTIARGDPGLVRLAAGSGPATAATFDISRDEQGRMTLPAGLGLQARRVALPGIRPGTVGVRVDNPGGDITVFVPPRVSAVLVRSDGDVAMSDVRGPYFIVAGAANVSLSRVFGFGSVRTTTGRVDLASVGGNVRVQTTYGSVTGVGMFPERAEIRSLAGDIDWRFARLGGGPYRFESGAGGVRLGIAPGAAANVDAQSMQGSVRSRFGGEAAMRFRSPHAMAFVLGGGGPQITAASHSGIVEIGPRRH